MKHDIKAILGANIKRLRNLKGLSQADFAQKISVQTQAVSQIENGKAYPTPKTVGKICEQFDVSPACLFSYARRFADKENSTREELLETVNMIISEMDDDKLEILISIMATLAEDSVKIKIEN